jgi:hypothetical protein
MIGKDSLHIDWITKVSSANRRVDKILVEKVIRALMLFFSESFHIERAIAFASKAA